LGAVTGASLFVCRWLVVLTVSRAVRQNFIRVFIVPVIVLVLAAGCSPSRFVANRMGNALAGSGTTFASDNDPELIRDAAPFSLKLMESVLAQTPDHQGLLLALSSGFTQYAYAFVQQEAEAVEDADLARARAMRVRARNLYLRARDYGLRGLEGRYRGFGVASRMDPMTAVARVGARDVPLLYWTAASWGAAISLSKDNPDLVADIRIVEAMMDRALVLDEDFNDGAIHGFMITYEMARPGISKEEAYARSRKHFDRVIELTGGLLASPYVSYAEQVCVARQDGAEFEAMLNKALAVDVDARPEWRLENVIMARRAKWLLEKKEDLILE
jgi:predicted anti-sigma-YlaC factor YlaD